VSTKTEILELVQLLCYDLADADEIDRFFGEVEKELAKDSRLWILSHSSSVQVLSDYVTLTSLNATAIFYEGRQLMEASQEELNSTNPTWREVTGTPVAYIKEHQSDHLFRLYPKSVSTKTVNVFETIVMTTGIPDILTLPWALYILAREFSRESNHRDVPFATACNTLGNEILTMVE
jgi:hypothetical protein